jgi:EAL domain-containing protein (putative c-di-GMP-specific phosphodiesterase class I)/ActR/RegA family two-component response regulator
MSGNHLLIMDDDPGVLKLLSTIGQRHRYQTTPTSTVEQFLAAYDAVAPSLLILDLQYQDSDGIALMSLLKERRCMIPIILVSGFDARVLAAARRVGEASNLRIVSALTKPVRLETIGPLLDAHREPEPDEWAAEIREGLHDEQFAVYYQPKVEISTGRVVGFEALARWFHPARGLVFPDRFIHLAEETGLIAPLTEYVLSRAIADSRSWVQEGLEVSVSVNIAAPVLTTTPILDDVSRLLQKHELPPARLILEVTEGTAMQHPELAMEILGRLRLRGMTLAIDDFGTGFSNLALLHQMPFNELKIDKRFVVDARTNRDSQVIVRALAGLATSLALTTVAEGVEDLEVLPWLRTLDIDQAQGFAIARPMPAERVLGWARDFSPPAQSTSDLGVA